VQQYAREVRLVALPDLPDKGDVSDYLKNHSPGELFAQMQAAPVWSTLAASAAPPVTLETAATVTADLLAKVKEWILRYVIVSAEQATIMAAWVLHTFVLEAADMTPYLHITAAEKASGKSLLMDVLAAIACKPKRSGGMTAAALVRTIDSKQPTLFLDEMDAAMGGNKEYAEAVRGILNDGFHRGGLFTKCDGNNNEVRDFKVFCCKAFAGIGRLPDTIASRSIPIEMRRKRSSEKVDPFRYRAVQDAARPIHSLLEDWTKSAVPHLQMQVPEAIPALGDRQNDIAEPLLAIAHLAGTEWLEGLTKALASVYGSVAADDTSHGVVLLADTRSIFQEHSRDMMPSKQLAELLCELEGRPWAEWSGSKPLTANQLANLLAKYHIRPTTIRVESGTLKGYRRADFEDAWERYCPLRHISTVTPSQPASLLSEAASTLPIPALRVTDGKSAAQPHKQRVVTGVTDGSDEGEVKVAFALRGKPSEGTVWV